MDQATIDNLSAQRIVHYLVTPYSQWEAGQRGIIDSDGNVKRKPTLGETQYYNLFHVICKRIRDLLKTSGKGTNWVLPANAGSFYLGQNIPATQFTNWSVANRSNLPIHSALMSTFKECLAVGDTALVEEVFCRCLSEEDAGTVAAQIVNPEAPMLGLGKKSKYKEENLIKSKAMAKGMK